MQDQEIKAQDAAAQQVQADAIKPQAQNTADQQAKTAAQAGNSAQAEAKAENTDDPKAELAAVQAQLEAIAKKAKADRDQLLLAVADAENARKRAEADVERERKYALERFVKALIPVVDSLDLALEHTDKNNPALKSTVEGLESTMTLFLKELKNFGVERLDPKGQPFDPYFHQAVSMIPSPEVKSKHVVAVMQKGFVLNGRVVRPAMVMVAK